MTKCVGSWRDVSRKLIIILTVSMSLNMIACNNKQGNERPTKVSTEIYSLSKFINLPYQPQAAWWQTTKIGSSNDIMAIGPTDWRLNAVLLFDNNEINNILKDSQLEYYSSSQIDADIIGNILDDHGILDKDAYKADMFIKSPLLTGVMVRIKQTNKIFLSLSTR